MESLGRSGLIRLQSWALALTGALLSLAGWSAEPSPAAPGTVAHPNVLLVTVDTCRADRIGCYGFALARTRCIDTLAREGVMYSNAISSVPITLPSHTTILTGLLPPAHGVRDNGAYALSDKAVTLAERLKEAGYATHAAVSALVLARQYNLSQGFDTYDDDLSAEDTPPMFMIPDRPAQRTSAEVVKWLSGWQGATEQPGAQSPRKPFFLWMHLFDPHQPWEAHIPDGYLCPTPYDAEIAQADHGIETVVNWLKGNGLLDQTLVIVTADHGESLGEHKEKTHAIFIYDATVHIPLVMRFPALIPPGTVRNEPVRTVDIVPTILGALGLPGGETTQGVNLLTELRNGAAAQYSESLLSELGFGMAPLFGVRSEGHKYIRAPRPELYDLVKDPNETRNIIEDNGPLADRLATRLDELLKASADRALEPVANAMDKETTQMLEALGYLAPAEERAAVKGTDPKDGIEIYTKLEDARNLVRRGRLDDAKKPIGEILAALPNHVSALNVLGNVEMQQGHAAEAEQAYQRSLKASPKQYRVMLSLGRLMQRQQRFDEAERWYQQALELAPKLVEAMVQLSFLETDRGNAAKAAEWQAKALTESPDAPQVRLSIADLHYRRKSYDLALEFYGQVLAKQAAHFHALLQAGVCSGKLGRADAAKDYYLRAAKVRPDSWVPVYNLACLCSVAGELDQGFKYLRETVEKASTRHGLPKRVQSLIEQDADLAALRAAPKYGEIMKRPLEPGSKP